MTEPWLAESVRLTALWGQESGADRLSWESVVGRSPDQQEAQPRLGLKRESGSLGDGSASLECRVSLSRVDWILVPVMSVETQMTTFPNVGTVDDAVDTLRTILFAKAAETYEAPRFAFGLTATRHTDSAAESYRELQSLLKNLNLNLDGTSDFLYQINRPRPSVAVPGMTINRVSRWMSSMVSGLRLVVPSQGPVARMSDSPINVTRVELDMSTPVDRQTPLPPESRAPLLEELVRLAIEQLSTGDTP